MFFKSDRDNLAICIAVIVIMIILLAIPDIMTAVVGSVLGIATLGAVYYGYGMYKASSGLSMTPTLVA